MKTALFEKYRPRTLDDVIAQPKACAQVRSLIARGVGGRAIWISGPSGSGKTTLAEIIAASIADDWMIHRVESGRELDADGLDAIRRQFELFGAGKGGRAIIINEAHGLNARAIDFLLTRLEAIPAHVVVVATSTFDGLDGLLTNQDQAKALMSRFIPVRTTSQGVAQAFAERAREIAQAEGLDGQPIGAYQRLLKECNNNMRAALQAIDGGCMAV